MKQQAARERVSAEHWAPCSLLLSPLLSAGCWLCCIRPLFFSFFCLSSFLHLFSSSGCRRSLVAPKPVPPSGFGAPAGQGGAAEPLRHAPTQPLVASG